MAVQTEISWADSTHNFWRGCAKVSPGCAHCYAESNIGVKMRGIEWGKGKPRVRSKSFEAPLAWNKKPWVCDACGEAVWDREAHSHDVGFHRRRVFSLSLGDWLDDEVPIEWLADMLGVIHRCPNIDFLLLTKRPENWGSRLIEAHDVADQPTQKWIAAWRWGAGLYPSNIWLGASVEDQQRADERIPQLLKIPARVRFLSVEPMLGPVDLGLLEEVCHCGESKSYGHDGHNYTPMLVGPPMPIHWVIFGGESGARVARPCNVEWIRDGVKQCKAAGVPVFVKQLGSMPRQMPSPKATAFEISTYDPTLRLTDKKGGDISEFPIDLRVREFPKV